MRAWSSSISRTIRDRRIAGLSNLLNVQQTFDRTSKLFNDGFATRAALDDAQKNVDVARTQVRTAELQVYTAGTAGSDYVMVQTQLNQGSR